MKKLLSLLCAALLAFTALAPTASARHWRGYHGGGHYYGHGHHGHGDALAAGVVGLAVGAIIGSAIARPRYAAPPPCYNCAPPPPRCYDRCGDGYGYDESYRDSYYEPPEERTCYARERQWDPYVGRYLMIERAYAC